MFADRLTPFAKLLPTGQKAGGVNLIRIAWDALSQLPGGKRLFSILVGRMAPYTSTIGGTVTVLRPGYAEVAMADRKKVRNHLESVHAIALANLGELAGNIALAYSLPDDARFIVSGLEIEYVKKARGTITAIGECPIPRTANRAQVDVTVILRDASGDEVARVLLHSLVGPKPGAVTDRTHVN